MQVDKKIKILIIFTSIIEISFIIGSFLFFVLGYKICKDVKVIVDWEGINSVTSWVLPTMMSAIAIFFSINIPKKIANQQNDISLFEKRYQVYDAISSLKVLSERIQNLHIEDDKKSFLGYMQSILKISINSENVYQEEKVNVFIYLAEFDRKISEGEFLFDNIEHQHLEKVVKRTEEFLCELTKALCYKKSTDEEFAILLKNFKKCVDDFCGAYLEKIEKSLKITDNL